MIHSGNDEELNFVDVTVEDNDRDSGEDDAYTGQNRGRDGSRDQEVNPAISSGYEEDQINQSGTSGNELPQEPDVSTGDEDEDEDAFLEFTLDEESQDVGKPQKETAESGPQTKEGEDGDVVDAPDTSVTMVDEETLTVGDAGSPEMSAPSGPDISSEVSPNSLENETSVVPNEIGGNVQPQDQQLEQGTSTGSELVATGGDLAAAGDMDDGKQHAQKGDGSGRIGDRMIESGVITPDQLNVALQEKKISGKLTGQTLVDLGFIDENTLTNFISESSGAEVFDPRNTIMDSDALNLMERQQAEKLQVLPVSYSEDEFVLAMADPYDVVAQDTLRRILPKNVKLRTLITTPSVISDAIDAAYGYATNINDILEELEREGSDMDVAALEEEEAYSHPVVRLVNALLIEAVKMGASDLHFEPEENFLRLRNRVDGVLFTAQILHKKYWNGISQRLKIMSGMNIADKLSPQDGRFNISVGGREADFRVSALPTVHGENMVLRVLDKSESIVPLMQLGFSEHNLDLIQRSQSRPEGIIIVTGPTGSGKSTSLYSMLNEINDVEVNVQTLEDPVEYSLPLIRQTHVREGVLEFGDGIRAMLRQDPDIVFIGEIRDKETAEMALKAAMTGHQVYTTLHTNDSFGAIPRLIDLGIKQSMISGSLISVFAQRLVRILCEQCKVPYEPDQQTCALLNVDPENPPTIYQARDGGCAACAGKGYRGRTALAEILMFNDEMDDIVADGGTKADMMHKARESGFQNMAADGIIKILEGLTSIEAVSKVVDIEKNNRNK